MSPRRIVLISVLAVCVFAPSAGVLLSAQSRQTAAQAAPAKATSWVVPATGGFSPQGSAKQSPRANDRLTRPDGGIW